MGAVLGVAGESISNECLKEDEFEESKCKSEGLGFEVEGGRSGVEEPEVEERPPAFLRSKSFLTQSLTKLFTLASFSTERES